MTTGARAAPRDLTAPPAALLDAVDERCRALAATAVGRVLTVPAEGAESALESEGRSGARYDTVLSLMCTPRVASVEGYVAAIERVLADEGWILMVEPARFGPRPRPRRLTDRLRHRLLRPSRGRGQDVVSAVRSRGLVITEIQRREAPSIPSAWRPYVVLRARRPSPQPAGT